MFTYEAWIFTLHIILKFTSKYAFKETSNGQKLNFSLLHQKEKEKNTTHFSSKIV